eukprot:356587-Chlamydomonas_euryale.AAC.4
MAGARAGGSKGASGRRRSRGIYVQANGAPRGAQCMTRSACYAAASWLSPKAGQTGQPPQVPWAMLQTASQDRLEWHMLFDSFLNARNRPSCLVSNPATMQHDPPAGPEVVDSIPASLTSTVRFR